MNILAVGAHFDDLELGCSGTLIKHVQKGDKVIMLIITDSSYQNPDGEVIRKKDIALSEGKKAAKIIGAELICLKYKTFMVPFDDILGKKILSYIEKLNINMIYSHWVNDIHRDHI
ncbi:N-acetylglucosaminyl phosphatidylinositol deacetylase, partial [Candidatus Magnetomorum sp. HK-1]